MDREALQKSGTSGEEQTDRKDEELSGEIEFEVPVGHSKVVTSGFKTQGTGLGWR